jgi:hypothetical protein
MGVDGSSTEQQRKEEEAQRVADEAAQREAERVRLETARTAEAATIAARHLQAVALPNIKTAVPITLEYGSAHYSKWRNLHLITMSKYALTDLVILDDAHPHNAAWVRMDSTVRSWLFGTISPELMDVVMIPPDKATARQVWTALGSQFLGNPETRAMILDAQFCNFAQDDLNITDYCRRLKGMADALGDLGEPVLDRTLVLSLLRGLNERFGYIAALLKRQKPFPSFIDARNELLLKKSR